MPMDFGRLVAPLETLDAPKGRLGAVMDMLTETTFGNPSIPAGADILEAARFKAALADAMKKRTEARSLPQGEERRIGLFQTQAALDALRGGQTEVPEDTPFGVGELLTVLQEDQRLEPSRRDRMIKVLQDRDLNLGEAVRATMDRFGASFARRND